MKRLFLLIFSSAILFGCSGDGLEKYRAAYKEYYKDNLKDPRSLVVYKETVNKRSEFITEFILDYGANNGFGGSIKKTDTILFSGDIMEVNGVDLGKKYAK